MACTCHQIRFSSKFDILFQYLRSFISCSCSLISTLVSEGHPELFLLRISFELKVMIRFYFSSLINILSIGLVSLESEGLFLGFNFAS